MDGNHITTIRTAAVGALAARALARKDSRVAAVLGCGTQGTGQAEALCHVLTVEEIRGFDAVSANLARFEEKFRARGVRVKTCKDAKEAVQGADVVVTATPAQQPVLLADWVEAGTHVNAFGTDTRGKNEVEAVLFGRATVVVDDIEQATTIGDSQHPVAKGILSPEDIHATLGEILAGRKCGRTRPEEITLFDATGLAFQDLIAGYLAVKLAEERGLGTRVPLH
jgi:ornithine cyclodeaminase/alanine dehydrogenase-like protein (mu-crystallin family)